MERLPRDQTFANGRVMHRLLALEQLTDGVASGLQPESQVSEAGLRKVSDVLGDGACRLGEVRIAE